MLGDNLGGGALLARALIGGRTGGAPRGGSWVGARYGLGLELGPGLISPPGTNDVNLSLLLAVPLQLGAELGLGSGSAEGWSGTVLGLDYVPRLGCVTGSDLLGGCSVEPLGFDLTVDPGAQLLASGESAAHLRLMLQIIAPVGGPLLQLGLGAGVSWY